MQIKKGEGTKLSGGGGRKKEITEEKKE